MNRPRRPKPAPPSAGDVEWHFLEARRLMEAGNIRAAMEQAGFGIRLDLERPDGYLMLGELNLLEGDLVEARRSFAAAAARSRGETKSAALAGAAQVAWLAGELPEAKSLYQAALGEDPSDPLNLRPALVEVLLRLGDVAAASGELAKSDDTAPDVHLLAALIHWRRGDFKTACASLRQACLENVYLAATLAGEDLPELGLVHGVEEATPEHARALAERLLPLISFDPGAAAFFTAVAGSATARRERGDLVLLARRLQAERAETARKELKRAIEALRDPRRIEASADAVLSEIRRAQPGAKWSGSFEV